GADGRRAVHGGRARRRVGEPDARPAGHLPGPAPRAHLAAEAGGLPRRPSVGTLGRTAGARGMRPMVGPAGADPDPLITASARHMLATWLPVRTDDVGRKANILGTGRVGGNSSSRAGRSGDGSKSIPRRVSAPRWGARTWRAPCRLLLGSDGSGRFPAVRGLTLRSPHVPTAPRRVPRVIR